MGGTSVSVEFKWAINGRITFGVENKISNTFIDDRSTSNNLFTTLRIYPYKNLKLFSSLRLDNRFIRIKELRDRSSHNLQRIIIN